MAFNTKKAKNNDKNEFLTSLSLLETKSKMKSGGEILSQKAELPENLQILVDLPEKGRNEKGSPKKKRKKKKYSGGEEAEIEGTHKKKERERTEDLTWKKKRQDNEGECVVTAKKKKRKHKKDRGNCEDLNTSVDLDVVKQEDIARGENEQQEETVETVVSSKKKIKKHGNTDVHNQEEGVVTPSKKRKERDEDNIHVGSAQMENDQPEEKHAVVSPIKMKKQTEKNVESQARIQEETQTKEKHKDDDSLLSKVLKKSKKHKPDDTKHDTTSSFESKRNKKLKIKLEDGTKGGISKLKEIFSICSSDSDDTDDVSTLEGEAQEIKGKNRLSGTEQSTLEQLRILVPWTVPPLHLIETRITMRPTEEQKKKIRELGVVVTAGTYYSKAEDAQITENWKKFCKMHNLPEDSKPFYNLVKSNGHAALPLQERLNFGRFLAHNLDNRLLCSVYKRFRRLFPPREMKNGSRFTPEEDKIIMKYIRKSSSLKPYSDLGALLGRNKLSIEKRARILGEVASFGNLDVKWDRERIEQFLPVFMQVTKVHSVDELQNRQISNEEWRLLEKRLDIPVRKLQKGWACRIFPALFAEEDLNTSEVKRSLVKLLIQKGQHDLKTVDWVGIQKELGYHGQGFTGRGLHEMLQGMIYHCVPVEERGDSRECLKYLEQALDEGAIKGRTIKQMRAKSDR